jgi:hypothetical protein
MKHASNKSNIDIVRGYLAGERPFVQVGFDPSQNDVNRKEGETWEDASGKCWIKKNGYRKRINKLGKVSAESARLLCSMCQRDMKWGNYLDDKIFPKTGRCYDCNIEYESKLKLEGKYKNYELEKVFKMQKAKVEEFRAKLVETIHHLETSTDDIVYFNEDGSKDVWKDTTREMVLTDAKTDLTECDLALERINKSLADLAV